MIFLIFRLIWALLWTVLCGIVDIISFIFTFNYVFGLRVDTMNRELLKPIDTFGEHGCWETRFHWAIWRIKLKLK